MGNRVIKDSIYTSPSLARLEEYYQDQFVRWQMMKDDWGCFNADPEVIKGIAYPKRRETVKKIRQIRDVLSESGHLFVWADESGREWGYFVNHDKHSGLCEYDSAGKRTKHRRRTPNPPEKPLCEYMEHCGTTWNNLEQSESDPDLDPDPDPNPDPISNIYVLWNEQNLTKHKSLTPDMKQAVKKALGNYDEDQVKQAIKVYAAVYHSKETYWSYKWGLIEFLQRGLKKFVDLSVEEGIANYKDKTRKDVRDGSKTFSGGRVE